MTTVASSKAAAPASPTAVAGKPPARWVAPVVLAIPFLIVVAALRGMTATLPIFHGSDETIYHLPTILRFGGQLPFPDLASYHAAQTPLFHLLFAYVGKVIGYQLWRLRLVEVLISYGLTLAVFALLNRRLRLPYWPALALTLLFALSPYVFGTSFRLLTDNLATLFVVLAVERLERYREVSRLAPFLAACAYIAAAVLTRQSAAFMLPVAGLYALRVSGRVSRESILAVGAVGLAAVPAAALFLTWHGLVPPGGDPGSCGLCSGTGVGGTGLTSLTLELALATIGLYGAVLFVPAMAFSRPVVIPEARGPLLAAAAGVLLLVLWPATPSRHTAGVLWAVAKHLPIIDGTSLLFWVLVPLAGAVIWIRLRVAPRPWLAIIFGGCFLLSTLAVRYPWQKYVDPFALLALLVTVRPTEFVRPRQLLGVAVLAVAFVAYALSFV